MENKYVLEILNAMQQADAPVGASFLTQNSSIDLSQATIGRLLSKLENEKLIKKVSNKGRVLTDLGRSYINKSKEAEDKSIIVNELVNLSTSNNESYLHQILEIRKLLEPYAAYLCAKNSTDEQIKDIENLVFTHRYMVSKGEPAYKEDLLLHLTIARSSGNIMLAKLIELLLSQDNVYIEFSTAGCSTTGKQIDFHFNILEAIKNRNSEGAKLAMQQHLERVTHNIEL